MASKLPEITNHRAALNTVFVDLALNSRKTAIDEKTVAPLAANIKAQGLMHPPLVIVGAQLGGKYAKHPLVAIAGFRRIAALNHLGLAESDFRLAPSSWGIKEALAANLAENLAREDISAYELAERCKLMRDTHKMTAPEIAKAVKAADPDPTSHVGLSDGNINNMIRALEKLDSVILGHWRNKHEKASLRFIYTLAAIDDKAKQVIRWRQACGEKIDGNGNPLGADGKPVQASGGADGTGTGDATAAAPASVKRPSRDTVLKAIAAIEAAKANKESGLDPDDADAMTAALMWAAGDAPTLPGVNLDGRKKAEATAPKTEAQKAADKAAKVAEKAAKKAAEAKAKADAAKAAAAVPMANGASA